MERNLTPAILSYEGIQYQYMAPGVFTDQQFHYIQEHLRILSGFYGLLKPFDGVNPYRLEMQAKLKTEYGKDLYQFWGEDICKELMDAPEDIHVLNLASGEYSKSVLPYLKKGQYTTVTFGEFVDGKVKTKGTFAKMARGEMVRWMAENQIEELEDVKKFDCLGYQYREDLSGDNEFVFVI